MIDFRYHIISLMAVFLALATGLVLGSTVLEKPVLEGTRKTADDLRNKNADLRQQLLVLQSQERASQGFVDAMAPKLLAGELRGKRIVLVQAPGAESDQTEQVSAGVKQAGGTVTGTVTLKKGYIDKGQVGVLGGLTETLAKTTQIDVPADAVPAERAGLLLGNALLTKDQSKLGKSDDTSTGTLEAFEEANFLDVGGSPSERASMAIVVGPATAYAENQASAGNNAIVTLAKHLDESGTGSVLTAPTDSAGPEGVVSALRGDDDVKKSVSTVDNLDAPSGFVVTVLALALDAGGKPGQWGSGTGADNVAPTPAVSPTKSP
ncbi:MAG: copper transporter [Streptosporangiales bacterium]|nr:copper transporter [Streptosporangiales bacterium]